MSFSGRVREELSRKIPEDKSSVLAETAAVILFLGKDNEDGAFTIDTDNITVAKACLILTRSVFDERSGLKIRKTASQKGSHYSIVLQGVQTREKMEHCPGEKGCAGYDSGPGDILKMLKDKDFLAPGSARAGAFLQGAFLAAGTMSNPGKSYHFEISCRRESDAELIGGLFAGFDINTKHVKRKEKYVVYLKDSGSIADALGVLGAHSALMELENIRIIKDMKNSANRQYNCDFANINKIVRASSRQTEDIQLIMDSGEFDSLPPSLKSIALVRLEHPDASLAELGDLADPPVGKSGVNHRLRKLSEIAADIRSRA